jgi:hypothetical protein
MFSSDGSSARLVPDDLNEITGESGGSDAATKIVKDKSTGFRTHLS